MTPPLRDLPPADQFAALWPDTRRLVGKLATRYARRGGCDRDDMFQAGTLAVWRITQSGKLAAHPAPTRIICRAAKWAMLELLKQERQHDPSHGWEPDAMAESFAAAEARDHENGSDFEALLRKARTSERDLLERRFRHGEDLGTIAARVGLTRQGVKQRIDRALERLRDRVEPANMSA